MGELLNSRHERFCQAYDMLIAQKYGTALEIGQRAYVLMGAAPNRANHNRLLARPQVQARLAELKHERESRARAARMAPDDILNALGERGLRHVADFFELDANRSLQPRGDLKTIPAELALAFVGFVRDVMGIREGLL